MYYQDSFPSESVDSDLNVNPGKKNVVIIGAGPSGLAALKAVLDSHEWRKGRWDVVALEAREEIGGIWLPAPSNHPAVNPSTKPALIDGNIDCSRVPPPLTPLYDSLTTNLPHPVMAYSAFPFPPSTPLFPKAEVVEDYLKDFARTFGLYKHIRFNERVVKAEFDHATDKWIVQTLSSPGYDNSMCLTYMSDLLLICNGHHNVPRYPHIPGLDEWLTSNCAAHAMFYRNPDCAPWRLEKRNKVLVVGGGPSGQDIVTDLIANGILEVIHSASRFKGQNPERVTRRGKLVKLGDVSRGETEFEGGVLDEGIDFVIFATGYEVQFPFLAEKYVKRGTPPSHLPILQQGLWNTSHGLFPLVRYLFPFSFGSRGDKPSLDPPSPTSIFFLGLPVRVVPMPLVEIQARLALSIFAKYIQVEWDVEARDVTTNYENLKALVGEEGVHKRYFRLEPMEQFDYRDELVEMISNVVDGNSVRRVRLWEREIYALKDVIRKEWRELEASGEAAEWVRDVGEGKTGSSAEEEWVELMRRVAVRST